MVPQQPQSLVSQQSDPSEATSAPGSGKEAAAPVPEATEKDPEESESEKDRGKDLKLPSYDGLTSLETFLAKFEYISRYRKWDDTDRFYQLCTSLDGPAGQILRGLAACATTDSVIDLLRTRFGNDLQVERFRTELKARRRKPGESLQFLYNDITRMVSLAHPTSVKDLKDHVAKEAFIGALDDEWLKMRVMDKQPENIEQALGIAGRLEAYESTFHVPTPPQELSKGEARPKLKSVYSVDSEKSTNDNKNIQKQIAELQKELAKLKAEDQNDNWSNGAQAPAPQQGAQAVMAAPPIQQYPYPTHQSQVTWQPQPRGRGQGRGKGGGGRGKYQCSNCGKFGHRCGTCTKPPSSRMRRLLLLLLLPRRHRKCTSTPSML